MRSVERFDTRSPHCNKIAGAQRLAAEHPTGLVVLCDADIAVLEDPRQIALPGHSIAAKTVDTPLPPVEVLTSVFHTAGVTMPPLVPLPWGPDQWTVRGNSNGGIYLVPGALLGQVASAWATWARWLLDRSELLQEWTVYVDQVAMALGLAAEDIGSHPLDVRWNTPTHDKTRIPTDPPSPAVLHYHQEVEPDGLIRAVGSAPIDEKIETANAAVRRVWAVADPLATQRRWLAGGDDARATVPLQEQQRAVISSLRDTLRPKSVVEIKGHAESVTAGLDLPHLEQVDPSGVAADGTSPADLTISLDVLPHLGDELEYRNCVKGLWESTAKAMVVEGYEDCFGVVGPDTFFHEPLSETIKVLAPEAEVYPVAGDGSLATLVALRPPAHPHPRDFPSETLEPLVHRIPDPVGLMEMRLQARQTTGFYPDHSPRLWEYPVVATLIGDHLPPGSRLIDVGAGVSPLAPYLTGRGYLVDTVDPSTIERTWSDHSDWNEWHFLDYAATGLAHRSWNCTLADVPLRPLVDGIYSVSVIEHVPAAARRALLQDISDRTRLDGLVVLTIDLMRGRDDLWNHNLGVEVEDPAVHGSFENVIAECAEVGLALVHSEAVREWPGTHVDIGLLALRQTTSPSTSRWRTAPRELQVRARRRRAKRSRA